MHIAVAVVFHHNGLVVARYFEQFEAALPRHDRAGGILVGRQGINKARRGTLAAQIRQNVGQRIDAHALLIERHPDQFGSQPLVRANRPGIRQFLGDDHVPRPFHQRLGYQRNRLHGAVHQRDVVRGHVDALALGFAHGHDLAQALMAHVAGIAH